MLYNESVNHDVSFSHAQGVLVQKDKKQLCEALIVSVEAKEKKLYKKARSSFVAAVSAILLSIFAPASVADASKTSAIEEVIVTAQKREQSIQNVGISITAFSNEQLRGFGIEDSFQIAQFTPGIHRSGSVAGQNSQFTIRGVAQTDYSDTLEAPVAVYVDEGYIGMQQGQTFGMFDIERVEVLKGPQGTLFGRNATGGLVHFVTRKPTRELEGYADVSYGSYDQIRTEAAIGGPLTETVAGRASFMYTQHDPIYNNLHPVGEDFWNEETYAGRAQLSFEPSEDLNFLVSVLASRTNASSAPYQSGHTIAEFDAQGRQIGSARVGPTETRIAIGPGGINVDLSGNPTTATRPVPGGDLLGYLDPDGADGLDTESDSSRDSGNIFETYGASLRAEWDINDGMMLTSISDYKRFEKTLHIDSDSGPAFISNFYQNAKVDQFTQELRVNGELENARWLLGFYYLYLDSVSGPQGLEVPGGPGVALGLYDYAQKETHSVSIFGQLEFDLTESLTFIGGLRTIFENQDFAFQHELSVNDVPTGFIGRSFADKYDETLWAGKAQLEWTPMDDLLIYAGINRGVKAGSFNQTPFIGTSPDSGVPFEAEVLYAYETGFKMTFLDGRAQLNTSLFYYDYENAQMHQFINQDGRTVNADAETVGIEADIHLIPVDGLDLRFSVAAFDAEAHNLNLGGIIRDVNPVYSPELQFSGMARYTWPAFNGSLAVQGDFAYSDEFFVQQFNYDAQRQGEYVIANARVSYTTADEKWEGSFFVENLADERYMIVGFDLAAVCGCQEDGYGKPRWFGGNIRYNF